LKLSLVLLLEEFPDSLGAPVRPVSSLLWPVRPVTLLSAFFFLSCPSSIFAP